MTVAAGRAAPAAAAALATLAACCGSPDFTVRSAEALHPGPAAVSLDAPDVRALHLADFGKPGCQQDAVAAGVAAAHARAPFDVALVPGDLVYECGPDATLLGAAACAFAPDDATVAPGYTPPDDPAFARFEAPLAPLARAPSPVAFHLGLGNHDVSTSGSCGKTSDRDAEARTKACLAVARRTAVWNLPGRHHAAGHGSARFLFVDTNLLETDYGGFRFEDEVAFVAAEASGCRADACEAEPGGCGKPWCFLLGHHPAATAGSHAGEIADGRYQARVAALLAAGQGRIRAWLGGHDHDLQHLRAPSGLDVFVSGAGARVRSLERFEAPEPAGTRRLFATVHWGYGVLEASPAGWRYRFESERGEALYCCAAAGPGRCEPAACAAP
ncbi:MAG: metallophosphoesterase [Anaeromyxobacter sp.]